MPLLQAKAYGATTHNLDALVTVAMIADEAQRVGFHDMLSDGLANNTIEGLVINWHHDATPWLCRFGRLQSQCFACARYLVKEGVRWKSLRYPDYIKQGGSICQPVVSSKSFLSTLMCIGAEWEQIRAR